MKNPASSLITTIGTIVTATIFLLFPLFFLTITTDFFTFPKQLLIVFGSLALFILWGVKVIADRKVTIQMNPVNIPILIFSVILVLSTFFSASPQDALLQSVPVILLGLFFFTTVNFIQDRSSFTIVVTSLLIGSLVSALLSILAQFNVFILPFAQVKSQTFNTHGSPVQYIAFIVPVLVICLTSIINIARSHKAKNFGKDYNNILQLVSTLVLGLGAAIAIYQIVVAPQKPVLLPFNHGFQIAFAAISQDSQRLIQSLFLGSGYGTFSTDFTRFVSPTFNAFEYWNLTFAFSSSYILELLATTGVLGFAAFIFIFINFIRSRGRNMNNPLFLGALSVFILALIIPFSYSMVFLLFALLALFVSYKSIENARGFDSLTLNFATLKQGLISLGEDSPRSKENLLLPGIILAAALITTVFVLFFLTGSGNAPRKGYIALVSSDMKFAESFTPEALKTGTRTYDLEAQAITEYPYRSDYYRLFSQINLALAANLVTAQQGKQPTQEVQNNIIALLQQSINSARQAVTISPYTSINWQNLGQIYRNLIGVGQNAEQFAVASYNQAITLNPSNPGLRIELGGIYYQLQQWELAQNQFTVATQLKPDYANAYYNLGHALEEKGDIPNAIASYQTVKQLVSSDPTNLKQIDTEIAAAQAKANNQTPEGTAEENPQAQGDDLRVNQPNTQFPETDPRVNIPQPPQGQPTPTPTSIPAPTNAPRVSPTPTPNN